MEVLQIGIRSLSYIELRSSNENQTITSSTMPELLVALVLLTKKSFPSLECFFARAGCYDLLHIIMVNVFPPNHVDDLPEVEPNQPDLAPAIPEHALVDENEEPKEEEEFKEKEVF
ncbi:hypothetical protein Tco_0007631 [Tanacetum coccineum]